MTECGEYVTKDMCHDSKKRCGDRELGYLGNTACLGIQVGAGIDGHQVLVWYGVNHLNIHSAMCISR